jgi:hypothetical protein
MNQLWQFGNKSEEEINAEIEENVSNNTKKTRESIWKQFSRLHSIEFDRSLKKMLFVTYLIYIDIHIQGDSKISLEKKR